MKFNKTTLVVILAIVAVIVLIIVAINHFPATAIAYEEKVTEAQSTIKVQEKRRADLIPNLVDCVQAYDQMQYETLLAVVAARQQQDGTLSDDSVNEIKSMINVVVEQYPQLSSQQNYENLMYELSITENLIADARTAYNTSVSRYNTYTRHPIHNFFLSLTGYEVQEFKKLDYNVSADAPTNIFG